MKDSLNMVQGGVAVTFPAWGQLLTGGWQAFIAIMGAAVLALTIWNKALEIKERRVRLKRLSEKAK